MKAVALLGLLVIGTACAPSRPYIRTAAPAKEIVFQQTRRDAIFIRGTERILLLTDEEKLTDMVACVPDAADYAGQVNGLMLTHSILKWTAYAAQITAIALFIGGGVQRDRDMIRAGIIVAPISAFLWWVKDFPLPYAFARTIDAVNAYNDQYLSSSACGPVRKPRPPPARPPPPPPLPMPPKSEEPGSAPR